MGTCDAGDLVEMLLWSRTALVDCTVPLCLLGDCRCSGSWLSIFSDSVIVAGYCLALKAWLLLSSCLICLSLLVSVVPVVCRRGVMRN